MKFTDTILIIDDVLDRNFCDRLITKFDTNTPIHVNRDDEVRDFDEVNLNQNQWRDELYGIIDPIRDIYLNVYTQQFPEYCFPKRYAYEESRMKRYTKGKGHFGNHVDVGDYDSARRFLVAFFYLNDVIKGGETIFNFHTPIKVPPKAGRLVMFPPMWMYPHAGSIPLSDNKYIAGTYLHYL